MARRKSRALEAALERLASRVGLELVRAEQLATLLQPVAVALRVPFRADSWAALERPTRTLVSVQVAPKSGRDVRPDLARVLARLQRVVQAEHFAPWAFLAAQGRARLMYVHSHGEQLGELRRWLARHPLVRTFPSDSDPAVVVPVQVEKL